MNDVRLGDISTRLKTLQVRAPYRGIVKLPAEPVVIIKLLKNSLSHQLLVNKENIFTKIFYLCYNSEVHNIAE